MLFPIFLDVAGRLAVVVGGGPVGQRRARLLTAAGARVRLVCLEAPPEGRETLAVEWMQSAYRPSHLEEAFLAIAAGPKSVNDEVVADARRLGILVNRADGEDDADFQVPALVRRGDLLVAFSTGGAAPAVAQKLRADLEQQLDTSLGPWLELLAELRALVRARVPDAVRRRTLFRQLSDQSWQERFRREGAAAVRQAVLDLV